MFLFIGFLLDISNKIMIEWLHRVSNGVIGFPLAFEVMACPVNAVEKSTDNGSSANAAHIFCKVTTTSMDVWQCDGWNFNNIIIVGF